MDFQRKPITDRDIPENAGREYEGVFIPYSFLIEQRIACPEVGYPDSEARFLTIEEWREWVMDLYP